MHTLHARSSLFRTSPLRWSLCAVLAMGALAVGACNGGDPDDPNAILYEGDDPGECSDGADNDRDGAFDCDDFECENAPVCNGVPEADADTDADADSDTDADADADSDADADADTDLQGGVCETAFCDLETMQITYTLNADFWFNLPPDCVMVYVGTGTFLGGDDAEGRLTFSGTWEQDSSTCPDSFDQVVWANLTTGEAYHTFFFNDSRTTIEHWFVHGNQAAYTTTASGNFYITDMFTPFDLGGAMVLDYQIVETDGGSYADFISDLDVEFTSL